MDKVVKRNGRPRKYYSAKDMQSDIDNYLNTRKTITINDKRGNPVECTPPLFYTRIVLDALGFESLVSSYPYSNGEYDDNDNNFSIVLARARAKCELDQLEGSAIGLYNDRIIRLNLMSNYNYSEKQETKSTIDVVTKPQSLIEAQAELLALQQENDNE